MLVVPRRVPWRRVAEESFGKGQGSLRIVQGSVDFGWVFFARRTLLCSNRAGVKRAARNALCAGDLSGWTQLYSECNKLYEQQAGGASALRGRGA